MAAEASVDAQIPVALALAKLSLHFVAEYLRKTLFVSQTPIQHLNSITLMELYIPLRISKNDLVTAFACYSFRWGSDSRTAH